LFPSHLWILVHLLFHPSSLLCLSCLCLTGASPKLQASQEERRTKFSSPSQATHPHYCNLLRWAIRRSLAICFFLCSHLSQE
jgi:hypothetical protein